jgi:hypothetical protein
MGELTEFVSAGQNMHLTLWDRKKIGIFRVGISLPLNLARSRQGGREETAPWRLRMRQNCVWCQLRWRENRGIASQFFLIIVASGDRFAFCGKLRIFFHLGFGFFFCFFVVLFVGCEYVYASSSGSNSVFSSFLLSLGERGMGSSSHLWRKAFVQLLRGLRIYLLRDSTGI